MFPGLSFLVEYAFVITVFQEKSHCCGSATAQGPNTNDSQVPIPETTAVKAGQMCGSCNESPPVSGLLSTPPSASLLHMSSVPCFKFVMRGKSYFYTKLCMRPFHGIIQGTFFDAVFSPVSCHGK